MTLLGIGVTLVGIAALVAAVAYAMEALRWSRSRTWWQAPDGDTPALADGPTTRWSEVAPSISERLRAYDPENPLDGQVFD